MWRAILWAGTGLLIAVLASIAVVLIGAVIVAVRDQWKAGR